MKMGTEFVPSRCSFLFKNLHQIYGQIYSNWFDISNYRHCFRINKR